MMENGIQLNRLQINNVVFTQDNVEKICNLQTLQEIIVLKNYDLSAYQIKRMATRLKNLKVVSFIRNEISIELLADIIRGATNLMHVEFTIRPNDTVNYEICEYLSQLTAGRVERLQFHLHRNNCYVSFINENMPSKPIHVTRRFNTRKSVLANE